ncbi:thiamine pyrophosphate-binding protein [Rhodopila sp.]|uniref:thiamine pyrophosphate-binding protein n=1 Tax=Rhodopila sp. TaxID=2480087 RepID=UPI002CBF9226|nr:thiamine pyrophosphate-binding protein [Rhodopila sp.]HVZ10722.1 thiamine pyrophosphate-binding protein [Rhodopila sp.]
MDNIAGTIQAHEAIARDLKALGIDTVFGLMSDDTAVFCTALDGLGITFHGARHENNAIAMAEGYAFATGRLGVAIIGRGPATANGLHAAVAASRMGSKLLIIYGEQAQPTGAVNAMGPDYKGFNAVGVLQSAGLRTFVATSGEASRSALADAIVHAETGTASALLLPTNVQHQPIEEPRTPPQIVAAARKPVVPRPQAIAAAAEVLRKANKPIIVAGRGAFLSGAKQAIEALAERTGALLITTAKGKDMFRGNPYNLGILGSFSHSMARRMVDQADCAVVFGAGLNFLTMSFGQSLPPVPLIQVDSSRANIGRYTGADIAVVGDAKLAAEGILAALPTGSNAEKPFRSEQIRQMLAAYDIGKDFQPANTPRTVDMRSLGSALNALLPEQKNIVYDAGNFLGVLPYLSVPGPGHFKMTSEFASIGLGFGTALGVATGRPDIPTILVIGDGGFLMTLGELETVVREDIPLIILVMNDCAYGAELHFLRMRNLPEQKSVFPDVDFAPVAAAFGFESRTIRTLDDLQAAAPLLQAPSGPVLLDCKLNADVAAPFMSEFYAFETGQH